MSRLFNYGFGRDPEKIEIKDELVKETIIEAKKRADMDLSIVKDVMTLTTKRYPIDSAYDVTAAMTQAVINEFLFDMNGCDKDKHEAVDKMVKAADGITRVILKQYDDLEEAMTVASIVFKMMFEHYRVVRDTSEEILGNNDDLYQELQSILNKRKNR